MATPSEIAGCMELVWRGVAWAEFRYQLDVVPDGVLRAVRERLRSGEAVGPPVGFDRHAWDRMARACRAVHADRRDGDDAFRRLLAREIDRRVTPQA